MQTSYTLCPQGNEQERIILNQWQERAVLGGELLQHMDDKALKLTSEGSDAVFIP